jgi:hypothetical protein
MTGPYKHRADNKSINRIIHISLYYISSPMTQHASKIVIPEFSCTMRWPVARIFVVEEGYIADSEGATGANWRIFSDCCNSGINQAFWWAIWLPLSSGVIPQADCAYKLTRKRVRYNAIVFLRIMTG